jgi:SAM-dependent methyltransferase
MYGYKPEFHDALSGAEDWHFWFRTRRARLLREIRRRLHPPSSFLDVGCGTGYFAGYLARKGFTMFGCDLFYKSSMREADVLIVGADALSLPLVADSFAGVGLFDIIEHLDEPEMALREAHRVLKPGGFVFITVPASRALWSAIDVTAGHRRRYSAGELRELLRGAGFLVRRVSYMFPCLFPFIYLARNNPSYNTPGGRVSAGKFANALASAFFYLEDVILDFVNWPVGTTVLGLGQKPMGQG